MPNHIRNKLIIKAPESKIKEVAEFLKGESDKDGAPCALIPLGHFEDDTIREIAEMMK